MSYPATCFPIIVLLSAAGGIVPITVHAQDASSPQKAPLVDLQADTWVGTDALGRTLPTAAEARAPRTDRFVGMFYFLTHGAKAYYSLPSTDPAKRLDYGQYGDDPRALRDNTEIIARVGGSSVTKPEGWKESGTYWWGEPAVGYFLADDPWVARRNLRMLADAGVDTIICDVTNGPQYREAYQTLFGVAVSMRAEGLATPGFTFITYASSGAVAESLYDAIYAKGRYKDLWFLWEGKPLIFGDKEGSKPNTKPPRPEVLNFFTWRHSWANTGGPGGNGKDEWEWSDSGDPQRTGWHDDPAVPEEMPVMAGGWATSNLGRSFDGGNQPGGRIGKQPPLDTQLISADVNKGRFFAQQWSNALKADPKFVFITGWNEWTANRQYGPGVSMLGQKTKPGEYYFVDNFNEEFSRDLMPKKGGYADSYYMQLVDYVRRYKGVRPVPVARGYRTFRQDENFAAWQDVQPVYHDAAGDTDHRDWPGWGGKHYTNNSGRNDIVESRVACDAESIYFYARTRGKLTPSTDPNWMVLLVDADQDSKTGWNGYDYAINAKVHDGHTTEVHRLSDGRTTTAEYRVQGNELMVTVPRTALGLPAGKNTSFDFHWTDNAEGSTGGMADCWYTGDGAPDGRFNYRYTNEGK